MTREDPSISDVFNNSTHSCSKMHTGQKTCRPVTTFTAASGDPENDLVLTHLAMLLLITSRTRGRLSCTSWKSELKSVGRLRCHRWSL